MEHSLSNARIPGYPVILAAALLSQGRATRPRALVAATDESGDKGIVAEYYFAQSSLGDGYGYSTYYRVPNPPQLTVAEEREQIVVAALEEFRERLRKDYERYVSRGIPLTGQPQPPAVAPAPRGRGSSRSHYTEPV